MREDAELLSRWVEHRSEEDFAELVGRYSGLVYHAALRRVQGRADIAKDITQDVFANLARQAGSLLSHPVLSGWLYTTTRFVANRRLRDEHRRAQREREAQMRNESSDGNPQPDLEQLYRELDGAMDGLDGRDREAILLRYFHGEAFAQIGQRVGLSEDAARKRVDRALERLRARLVKQGVVSSAVALGSVLSAQAAQTVPTAVAQSLATAALAQAAAAKLPAAALLYFMTAKLSMQLAAGVIIACLLIVSGTGVIVHEVGTVARLSTDSTAGEDARKADAAMLDELRSRVEAGEQRLARLQSDVDQAQKTIAASTIEKQPAKNAASSPVVSRPDGSHPFLEAYPQARSILIDWGRAQLAAKFAGFYATAQLTPAQIEAFETRTTEFGLKQFETTEKSIKPTKSELPAEEIRAMLGETAYKQFEEFKRVESAYGVASRVAYAAGFSGTPLSKEQSVQFAQLIAANAPAAGNLASNDVDWDAVMKQSGTLFAPAQFNAAQPILLKLQFQQAVSRAQEKAQRVSSADKKP
jgi:RNA polymerase sigma factor (sigma-70 family)